ncbi:hypothetical protein M8C21_012765, partial [Ambrosia artemisiifolia]
TKMEPGKAHGTKRKMRSYEPIFRGLSRSGNSCRLQWMNYVRPNMKHGNFTKEEDMVCDSFKVVGKE